MPLFLTGNGFSSTLSLVNSAADATYADLTLRDLSGQTVLAKRLDFKPHSEQRLDLGQLLEQAGSPATRGSLTVRQSASLAGRAIMGTLAMTYDSPGGLTYIDEEPPDPNVAVSSTLVGVADPSSGAPILAIASLAAAVQHVKVECLSEGGAFAASQLTLAPGQTSIAAACPRQEETSSDADPLMAAQGGQAHGAVGIRLTSDGTPGALSAFALAPHNDDGSRGFSSVLFSDPQAAHSSSIVFAGVPVGSTPLLPSGMYIPQISLANFSTAPLHVHTTFAHTDAGNATTPQEVNTVTLAPGTSREITLAGLSGDPDLQNSFILASDGAPGALAAKFVAHGEGPQLRRLELQAKDERSSQNAGRHPWSIEDGAESTLLLFNHGSTPQKFTVALAGSETWQKTYTLPAMATKAIGIRDLIEDRTTDDLGRVLSKSVQSGEASWFVPDSTQSSGRLLVSNRATGMARNYSCGYSNLLCGANVLVTESLVPNGSVITFATIQAITCTNGTLTACSGQQTGTGGYFNTTWNSESPNIASISGSNATSSVNLLGNALGSSYVNARIQSNYCQSGGGGTAAVVPMIQIRSSGNKTAGDNLTFPSPSCSQTLGSVSCLGFWGFNIEAVINTPTSIAGWTVSQNVLSNFQRGVKRNTSTGALTGFSGSTVNGPDGPDSSHLQNQGTGTTIYYIDIPGVIQSYDPSDVVDSITYVINFETKACRNSTGACTSQPWFEKIVVNPGGVFNTASSSVGNGSMSTNF